MAPISRAHADGHDGEGFYEMLFGSPDSRNKLHDRADKRENESSCDEYDGIMGSVNGFFCHMEKDLEIKGVGSKTKVFGNLTVHAEVTPVGVVVFGGVTYNYAFEAKVWVCQSNCTVLTNFKRAYYIAFSYAQDGTINKGFVLNEPGVFDGSPGSGLLIHYDLGSSTAVQFVRAKAIFTHGGLPPTKMDAYGEKTSSSVKLNVAGVDGSSAGAGFRYALSTSAGIDQKFFNMYFESAAASGSGTAALDAAALNPIATSAGFCSQGDERGSTLSPLARSTGSCSALAFNPFKIVSTSVSAYTAASVLASDSANAWNAMTTAPSAL